MSEGFWGGVGDTLKGYGAHARYYLETNPYSAPAGRGGDMPSARFTDNVIEAGMTLVSRNNQIAGTAAEMLFDQRVDQGIMYNVGTMVPGAVGLGKVQAPATAVLGTRVGVMAGKVGANTAINITGAMRHAGYEVYGMLREHGIYPPDLDGETMGKIGLAILSGAEFSYDSKANVLHATARSQPNEAGYQYNVTASIPIGK